MKITKAGIREHTLYSGHGWNSQEGWVLGAQLEDGRCLYIWGEDIEQGQWMNLEYYIDPPVPEGTYSEEDTAEIWEQIARLPYEPVEREFQPHEWEA